MRVEDLINSITNNYLHFTRVDSYSGEGADLDDGQQLPKDKEVNAGVKFERAPEFSALNYYDQSRARTYACCFSMENSHYIWENYGNNSAKGKVCLVFAFGGLRCTLNRTLAPGNAGLEYNGIRCHQIFSINYGKVEYVDWQAHQTNAEYLANPILYTYLKDKQKFSKEKELRIALSTIGTGHFALNDGSIMNFPPGMPLFFDYRAAIAEGTIREILYPTDFDSEFLKAELNKLGISQEN